MLSVRKDILSLTALMIRLWARPARGVRCRQLSVSGRVLRTEPPVIVRMKELMEGKSDVLSLAQGIVHWEPPADAIAACAAGLSSSHAYQPAEGLPALREALRRKIRDENGLSRSEIMVTAGANQAYANLVIALLDSGDRAALLTPYYFNHLMALQMTGCEPIFASTTPELLPDVAALEREAFDREDPARMVTLVNPGNPTGVTIPREILEAVSDLCARRGAWLVLDNTYEHFAWGLPHDVIEGDHVVNIFSFSKAFGMMGWRVGYLAYPPALGPEILKVQDTVVICPTAASQLVALGALEAAGRPWVSRKLLTLEEPKRLVRDALVDALGVSSVRGGSGAIYLLGSLPDGAPDDERIAERLITEFGVATVPGSACGAPGTIRVCYANLPIDDVREAARRLSVGLRTIVGEETIR
ncbi:hypothetical protein CTAYLR_010237 [Chrysophaeum taylorii]|uniref:Aminotransferase class I/classII large domain-containing protein n=1 Tax=Chrysophaeum taylorii TaxID=2483200 RepID=A0AAD7XPM6_9STRA|nr:hypothetical protein CTAYLR_009365 [Chrysophaeum taylorii]KAJ8609079.1 hypothetical protein CTAYLR_010237 [Chrysophaeum taylorii]